jgi:hypothetical protein
MSRDTYADGWVDGYTTVLTHARDRAGTWPAPVRHGVDTITARLDHDLARHLADHERTTP